MILFNEWKQWEWERNVSWGIRFPPVDRLALGSLHFDSASSNRSSNDTHENESAFIPVPTDRKRPCFPFPFETGERCSKRGSCREAC